MGTTDPLPARVRELAAENETIKAENWQLKGDQYAALELLAGQEARIVALTGQVAELAKQVAAEEPAPEEPTAEPAAAEPAPEPV